jgi:hypothetical protein
VAFFLAKAHETEHNAGECKSHRAITAPGRMTANSLLNPILFYFSISETARNAGDEIP